MESCRIIDQFAERTGDAAWQTVITLEGVNTLRRLLRKTAAKYRSGLSLAEEEWANGADVDCRQYSSL